MNLKKGLLICSAISVLLGATPMPVMAQTQRYTRDYTPYYSRRRSPTVNSYLKVNDYLRAGDYVGLKTAIAQGLSLEAKNSAGDTPICVAVKRKDYTSFNVLKSLGANLMPSCMQKISVERRRLFLDNYLARGGYLSPEIQDKMLTAAPNWPLWGGVGASVVGAGAIIAVAAGGGGGGSSSGGEEGGGGVVPPDEPDNPPSSDATQPAFYRTREFTGGNFTGATNFLGQIRADYAYASATAQSLPVAGEGVRVGVIDDGLDVHHRDLKDNILKDANGKVVGASFNYGPCRGGDRTNCWAVTSDAVSKIATFYDASGAVETQGRISDLTYLSWIEYDALFPSNWDWDTHKDDPTPVSATEDSHGTHVGGIIAAMKDDYGMHGVAYNAKLIGVQLGFGWVQTENDIKNAFKFQVDNGAQVINNSWGQSGNYISNNITETIASYNSIYRNSLTPSLEYARDHGSIVVFAAGNDGDVGMAPPQAGIEAAAPMIIPSLLYYNNNGTLTPYTSYPSGDTSQIVSSLFVSVVSVGTNNNFTYYSQKCGAAARWCIAAPGGDLLNTSTGGIASTVPGEGYDIYQGTSMAAPVVVGSIVTILGAFPSLKPEEAVAILFETATDIGAAGVDEEYGWGLVNLGAAMQPVGNQTLALGTSTTEEQISFANTRMTVPSHFAKSLQAQLPEKLVVLDKYRRGFNVDTSSVIHSTSRSKQAFANDLRLFTQGARVNRVKPSDKFEMQFSQNKSPFDSEELAGMSFDMTYNLDKLSFNFNFTQDAKTGMSSYFDKSLRNPFTSSATDLYGLSGSFKLLPSLAFNVGAKTGKNNFFDGNEQRDYRNDNSLSIADVGLTYKPFERLSVNFSSGFLNEESALLGMNGSGAFDIGDSRTYFMGVDVKADVTQKLQVGASYYYGTSRGTTGNTLMQLSDVRSESVAVHASYALNNETTLGVRGASPLSIRKATAFFDLPTERDATEEVVYRKQVVANLKSEAREWDVGLYGIHQMGAWTFQAEGQVRFNPDYVANSTPDYRMMFSVGFGY